MIPPTAHVQTINTRTPLYRVHRTSNGPAFFDTGPHGRFNPPATCHTFGTCYLAVDPMAAFLETCGRRSTILREDIEIRSLTTVTLNSAIRLFDILDPRNRAHFHGVDLTGHMSASFDYDRTQPLAQLIFEEGFAGVWYKISHDPSLTLTGIGLFGEPGDHDPLSVFATCKTDAIPVTLVSSAEGDYGVEVTRYGP
jgi:RES domain